MFGSLMELPSDDYVIGFALTCLFFIAFILLLTYSFYSLRPESNLTIKAFSLFRRKKENLSQQEIIESCRKAVSIYQSFLAASFFIWVMNLLVLRSTMFSFTKARYFQVNMYWEFTPLICFFLLETFFSRRLRWVFAKESEADEALGNKWVAFLKIQVLLSLAVFLLDSSANTILKEVFFFTLPVSLIIYYSISFAKKKFAKQGETE